MAAERREDWLQYLSYEERIVGPPTWVREGMLTVSCKPILAYTISLTLFSLEPP